MIYSMTGFGRKEVNIDGVDISIELKTLNTKFFDVSFKLPNELKAKEIELRQLLSSKLLRGKADFGIFLGNSGKNSSASLNNTVLKSYLQQLKDFSFQNNLDFNDKDVLPQLIRLPEVFSSESDFWTKHWNTLLQHIHEVIDTTMNFRKVEGDSLAKDLTEKVKSIETYKNQVEPFEAGRITKLRAKLQDQFNNLDISEQNRFEQEIIYYLERLDISEEKVRLQQHCDYFLELLNDDKIAKGKRLNFVAQEMGREINTLGSKANDADIQRLVILMKDDLEKIKEQVLNTI